MKTELNHKKLATWSVFLFLIFTASPLIVNATEAILLTEDFEDPGVPTGWLNIDSDGDTYDWDCDRTLTPHGGSGCATSASFISNIGALSPDNWLITSAIDLSGYSSIELSYWVAAQDNEYANDQSATTGRAGGMRKAPKRG